MYANRACCGCSLDTEDPFIQRKVDQWDASCRQEIVDWGVVRRRLIPVPVMDSSAWKNKSILKYNGSHKSYGKMCVMWFNSVNVEQWNLFIMTVIIRIVSL